MKATRHLIITTLTFIFVLTLNVYAQERKTKKEVKKQGTEKIKKNEKTETVPKTKNKHSSQTLKKGSKGTDVKSTKNTVKAFGAASQDIKKTKAVVRKVDVDNKRAADGNTVKEAGTKKAVKSFQKKGKLDSNDNVSPKAISEANNKKVKAKKTSKQKKKNKQLKKKQ